MGEESQSYIKVISHPCTIPEGRGGTGIGDDDGYTVLWHITNIAGQARTSFYWVPSGGPEMKTWVAKLSEVALSHTLLFTQRHGFKVA